MNGAPAKPISGSRGRQVGARLPHRFHHEVQLIGVGELDHPVDVARFADRIVNLRPFVLHKLEFHAHRLEDRQQIGKHNRRVDAKLLNRRAHHFATALRVAAELEEAQLLADRAILGHVAAGLAHQPDWREVDRLAAARAEKHAVVPGRGFWIDD